MADRRIKCKICRTEFVAKTVWNRRLCSPECVQKNFLQTAAEQQERKKKKVVKRKCRQCDKEVTSTAYCPQSFCGGKAGPCYRKFLSAKRVGKKNPAYRNGKAMQGKRTYTGAHLRACSKYRKAFLKKHNYPFCELCGANEMQTLKFEVHHIYFASLWPKHPNLHDFKNLIHLCIQCHNDMHAGKKMQGVFEMLEQERGLKELFKKHENQKDIAIL